MFDIKNIISNVLLQASGIFFKYNFVSISEPDGAKF